MDLAAQVLILALALTILVAPKLEMMFLTVQVGLRIVMIEVKGVMES